MVSFFALDAEIRSRCDRIAVLDHRDHGAVRVRGRGAQLGLGPRAPDRRAHPSGTPLGHTRRRRSIYQPRSAAVRPALRFQSQINQFIAGRAVSSAPVVRRAPAPSCVCAASTSASTKRRDPPVAAVKGPWQPPLSRAAAGAAPRLAAAARLLLTCSRTPHSRPRSACAHGRRCWAASS